MSDWFDLPDPVIAALRAKLQEAEVEKDQLRMDRDRLQSQVDICYYKDSVKEIARLQAEVERLRETFIQNVCLCDRCSDALDAEERNVCWSCSQTMITHNTFLQGEVARLTTLTGPTAANHWHDKYQDAQAEVARLKGSGYTGRFGDLIDIQDRRIAALEAGLRRLRDCDWVITPADRMDAVRDIARTALASAPYCDREQSNPTPERP